MNTISIPPVILIGSSFLVVIISLISKKKHIPRILAVTTTFIVFLLTTYNLYMIESLGKPIVYKMGGWPPPLGIIYEVDLLGALMGLLTSLVIFLVAIYSLWYLSNDANQPYYYSLLLGLEAGLIGIFYTGDVFNLFVMIEVMSITSYGLVAYYKNNRKAIEAATKYSLYGLVAGLVYFLACIMTYSSYGTLTMGLIASLARPVYINISPELNYFVWGNIIGASALIIALSIWSFTFLSGIFPNHFWLPDAHPAAPSPISAVLSGLVVNAGLYSLLRFFYTIFGIYDNFSIFYYIGTTLKTFLIIMGSLSMIYASIMMAIQSDAKRLIAYSTIVHTSLIFIGISLGNYYSVKAAIYHTITHSISKALLFLSIGVVIKMSNTRELHMMFPMGRKNPIVGFAVLISIISLIGVPPVVGFFSKLTFYQAFIKSNDYVLITVLLISTGIALIGYLRLLYASVFKPESTIMSNVDIESSLDFRVSIPLIIMIILLIILNPLIVDGLLTKTTQQLISSMNYIGSALESFMQFYAG